MITNSYKLDLFNGLHQPGDIYQMALYNKPLDVSVVAYQTANEALGPGYKPGGVTLAGRAASLVGVVALLGWASPVWLNSSLSASYALIYNYTRERRSVAVIDLGGTFTSSNGPFTVDLPALTPETALISIG